ncbi:hypothetical protein HGA64_02430, partial [Candidatus Falkowbacteria bacterium]|nr:hypothetical protein [Candidatus Falkowbacteria bacterium]
HLPGQDLQVKGLKSLAAHLKPDGRLVVTVWALLNNKKYFKRVLKFAWLKILGKNNMDFGDIIFGWGGQGGSQRYYHAFTKQGLNKIINKAGLKIEKMFNDGHSWYMILKK